MLFVFDKSLRTCYNAGISVREEKELWKIANVWDPVWDSSC